MKTTTLFDILTAWQSGRIGYRQALQLAQIDTLDELYDAATLSGVKIRSNLSHDEEAMGKIVGDLIRGQVRLRTV